MKVSKYVDGSVKVTKIIVGKNPNKQVVINGGIEKSLFLGAIEECRSCEISMIDDNIVEHENSNVLETEEDRRESIEEIIQLQKNVYELDVLYEQVRCSSVLVDQTEDGTYISNGIIVEYEENSTVRNVVEIATCVAERVSKCWNK